MVELTLYATGECTKAISLEELKVGNIRYEEVDTSEKFIQSTDVCDIIIAQAKEIYKDCIFELLNFTDQSSWNFRFSSQNLAVVLSMSGEKSLRSSFNFLKITLSGDDDGVYEFASYLNDVVDYDIWNMDKNWKKFTKATNLSQEQVVEGWRTAIDHVNQKILNLVGDDDPGLMEEVQGLIGGFRHREAMTMLSGNDLRSRDMAPGNTQEEEKEDWGFDEESISFLSKFDSLEAGADTVDPLAVKEEFKAEVKEIKPVPLLNDQDDIGSEDEPDNFSNEAPTDGSDDEGMDFLQKLDELNTGGPIEGEYKGFNIVLSSNDSDARTPESLSGENTETSDSEMNLPEGLEFLQAIDNMDAEDKEESGKDDGPDDDSESAEFLKKLDAISAGGAEETGLEEIPDPDDEEDEEEDDESLAFLKNLDAIDVDIEPVKDLEGGDGTANGMDHVESDELSGEEEANIESLLDELDKTV